MSFLFHVIQTSLYVAASKGHTAVVEMLLKAGVDVNKVSLLLHASVV